MTPDARRALAVIAIALGWVTLATIVVSLVLLAAGCAYDNLVNVDLRRECKCERCESPEPGLYIDGERIAEHVWSINGDER